MAHYGLNATQPVRFRIARYGINKSYRDNWPIQTELQRYFPKWDKVLDRV